MWFRRLRCELAPRAAVLCLLLLVPPSRGEESVAFRERSGELGVDFRHRHFGVGEKYMPENMAPGVLLFDADSDGRLDLFFPQGAPIGEGSSEAPIPGVTDRFFRQRDDGTFEDRSESSGLAGRGYGMGAYAGDVDGDGHLDIYVTRFGGNVLYRNRGDGTFEDVTQAAGVGEPRWSTGAGFYDPDGDGDLDLLVVQYVDFAFDNHRYCGDARRGLRSYCHPDVYNGVGDTFYRNEGGAHFVDATAQVGFPPGALHEKGLGVIFSDFDADGLQDAYVGNDSTMNRLYLSRVEGGRLRFEESALLAGVGHNGSGAAEASMGLAVGDYDGDGELDLFVTHLDKETNTLYRRQGPGLFSDVTERAGLAAPSLPWVGFGTVLFDYDHDADLDLFVANGHIIDNLAEFNPEGQHAQPAQLFDNQGDGRFVEVSPKLGLEGPLVARGVAAGDLDRDGDLDLVLTQNGGPALVLVNEVGQDRSALVVRLVGRRSNRFGFGARLEVETIGSDSAEDRDSAAGPPRRIQVREMQSSSSYMSQGPPEIHVGLGDASRAEQVTVTWPSGVRDRYEGLEAGYLYTFTEGEAEVARTPFSHEGVMASHSR